ncbi:threonine synthase [Clostridium tarantellae]|uniref:Threonine synthase n=1 Tax=Clostridium tarantellae TaxID=39493 RepID=A0A6I1MQP1_9CLOT|nr:threonine synthase [Clostridium tarantellae]MPQ44562.1 threonine synthase [Clostridium tarantellae]
MNFISTRGGINKISSTFAVLKGIADNGGLFVPENFPYIYKDIKKYRMKNYCELSFYIIKKFFQELGDENIKECIDKAYKNKFKVKLNNSFLELYHGPTYAFKDAALLLLPQLMKKCRHLEKIKDDIVILTATSGDTGKAALEGFKNIDGIKVIVFYPDKGVSTIQELQMKTSTGGNVYVVAIDGNFDDAQRGVKNIFNNEEYKKVLKNKGIMLSSANSINIGRLIPQIVYYFYGYFNMVNNKEIKEDEEINVVVPTGNFGNILAAYYAKKMGLPIKNFICASNENNVLTDFLNTGEYNKNRELILTTSPSMDILVSSNLERLLFELSNRDSELINYYMNSLNNKGKYRVNDSIRNNLKEFYGEFATGKEVSKTIKDVLEEENYLIDPHTAVAYICYKKYLNKTGDKTKKLIISTASPFKFTKAVLSSLNVSYDDNNDFHLLKLLSEKCSLEIPVNLRELEKLPIFHNKKCKANEMKNMIMEVLNKLPQNI